MQGSERFIPEAFFGFVMRARRRFLPISCRHSRCRPTSFATPSGRTSVDGIYDIHYMDDAGKEILPEEALRKLGARSSKKE